MLRGSVTVRGTADHAHEIDLTGFLKSELAAGRKQLTLALKNPNVSQPFTIFGSDETVTAAQLVIA